MADLKKSNAALKKLFQRQPPSWSPEEDVKRTEIDTSNNGKKATIEEEYKLLFKGSRWLAYDVVTDEQVIPDRGSFRESPSVRNPDA